MIYTRLHAKSVVNEYTPNVDVPVAVSSLRLSKLRSLKTEDKRQVTSLIFNAHPTHIGLAKRNKYSNYFSIDCQTFTFFLISRTTCEKYKILKITVKPVISMSFAINGSINKISSYKRLQNLTILPINH